MGAVADAKRVKHYATYFVWQSKRWPCLACVAILTNAGANGHKRNRGTGFRHIRCCYDDEAGSQPQVVWQNSSHIANQAAAAARTWQERQSWGAEDCCETHFANPRTNKDLELVF